MDNQNMTPNDPRPTRPEVPRARKDSITPDQRRGMQQGYPVRDDATTTIRRPVNRPQGQTEIPDSIRRGKIPVRTGANTGRTYPVMNRGQNQPVPDPAPKNTPVRQETKHAAPVMTADRPAAPRENLNETREFPMVAPAVQLPPEQDENTAASPKKLWILPLAVAVLAALGLCIGIPAAMSSRTETLPDFDMSADYTAAETDGDPDDAQLDEHAGVGRDETETETTPAETQPQEVKFPVTLTFWQRDPITVSTSAITLGELLELVDYTVQDSDKFPLDLNTVLTEETTIAVDTVEYGTAVETVTLPYSAKETQVQTIPRGQRQITQYGQNGTKTITYTTQIVNGVEISREVASEEITKYPVDELSQVGVGGTLVGSDGVTYSYSHYRLVNATYYDIEGLTYLGYDADESVVAVDMDYIPLGTKLYVKNDQFDFGVRIAADTGSMIEEWEVDIWIGDDNPQKSAFAHIGYVRDMVIYYLD